MDSRAGKSDRHLSRHSLWTAGVFRSGDERVLVNLHGESFDVQRVSDIINKDNMICSVLSYVLK